VMELVHGAIFPFAHTPLLYVGYLRAGTALPLKHPALSLSDLLCDVIRDGKIE
jgi:hypothetical protein